MIRPPELKAPKGDGPRIFFSVGDHSGDLDGALLIEELRKRNPNLRLEGIGGEAMIQAGMHCHYNMLDLGVMFFLEVFLRLPTLGKIYDQLYRYFETDPPDLLVLIDYPGFNLFLSKKARQCNIPTHYYIVPQLWAWAPWRIKRVKKRIDRMSVLFDFEKKWYLERGMSHVETAGHPLYDHLKSKKLNQKALDQISDYAQEKWVVGLMPGSRTREVKRNFPTMIAAAKKLQETWPNVVFVIPCPKKKLFPLLQNKLKESQFSALLLPGFAHEVMSKARISIVTSGTVTIELLYYKVPSIVIYKIGWFANKILKLTNFLQCDWITLVNILANEEVFPERLDSSISTAWIVEKAVPLIQEGTEREQCLKKINKLHQTQIKMGSSQRAAEQILGFLDEILKTRKDFYTKFFSSP